MGLITDIFYGLSDFFKWSYGLLELIGEPLDWVLFVVGCAMLVWWCLQLAKFGNDNEKKYKGW